LVRVLQVLRNPYFFVGIQFCIQVLCSRVFSKLPYTRKGITVNVSGIAVSAGLRSTNCPSKTKLKNKYKTHNNDINPHCSNAMLAAAVCGPRFQYTEIVLLRPYTFCFNQAPLGAPVGMSYLLRSKVRAASVLFVPAGNKSAMSHSSIP